MIEAIQRALKIDVDGKAGPDTWAAIYAALVSKNNGNPAAPVSVSAVDARSEKNIATLLLPVQPYARLLVQKAAATGIDIKIISGSRSYAEQDALYAQGRTTAGKIVTRAKGGYSNHNFGIAFDIGVFSGSNYLGESTKYKAVGALGLDLGLEWGGNWTSIVDQPHFQLRPSWAETLTERQMLTEMRRRVADGVDLYA